MTTSILTCIFGWPLLAALALIFVPRNYRVIIRAVAIVATFISMVLAMKMFVQLAVPRPAPPASDSSSKFPGWNPSASAITWAWTA